MKIELWKEKKSIVEIQREQKTNVLLYSFNWNFFFGIERDNYDSSYTTISVVR